ncbi:MAG: indole-3-glycerol phosphate synthase TrpC [Arcanobacterium sp.]|nr:indole-3-glycerol phosphate synthase TrpC [Arcanobacterium sp.]
MMATTIIDEIAARRRETLKSRIREIPRDQMETLARQETRPRPPSFEQALQAAGVSFICEIKKASPSKGLIAADFPYLDIARDYCEGGAAAISVLTEPHYFLGSDDYLRDVAQNVPIPVLRKDFIIDSYQIYEARVLGAAAVLLISSLLSDEQLAQYIQLTHTLDMAALVEAHTAADVQRSLDAGARIVGVNNRDLRTFAVDFSTTARLRELVPPQIAFVAESGVHTRSDVQQLELLGVHGILIGETLMRAQHRVTALRELRGERL